MFHYVAAGFNAQTKEWFCVKTERRRGREGRRRGKEGEGLNDSRAT